MVGFHFQVNEVPLTKKISSSIKEVISINKDKNSPKSEECNGTTKKMGFEDDDLEKVNLASKANKSVMDDAAIVDFIGTGKKETAADFIDKASRVLFPLSFIIFNIVYWVYFSLFG